MTDDVRGIDLTNMEVFALTAHEMFTALVGAGFTEDMALSFVAKFAIESGRRSDDEDD